MMMMTRLLLAVSLLAIGCCAEATAPPPHRPALLNKKKNPSPVIPTTSLTRRQLAVRGGDLGPITSDIAGKVLTWTGLLQGAADALAPEQQITMYGGKASPLSVALMESYGINTLASSIMAYALLFQDTTLSTAIGSGYLAVLAHSVKSVLTDAAGKLYYKRSGPMFTTALVAFATYSAFTNQGYATNLYKVLAAYKILLGLLGVISPTKFTEMWGGKPKLDLGEVSCLRCMSFSLIAAGVMVGSLVSDVAPAKAFAYCIATYVAMIISNVFITKEPTKLRLALKPMYAWILYLAVLCASILLETDVVPPIVD